MRHIRQISHIRPIKKIKLRTWVSLGLLLVLLPIVFLSLFRPQSGEAAWFDQGYGFRKKIPVTNASGSTQTDFQLQATIDTATLITAGKMQSDCDDIRFTGINGKVLSYWLEPNTCNTASTLVWFKADSLPTTGAEVYFYYGNPSAESRSSSSQTFIRDMTGMSASWPLNDTDTTQSYARDANPYEDEGRNIVLNGTFDDASVWLNSATWVISGGVATGTNESGFIYQTLPFVAGKAYKFTITLSGVTGGGVTPQIGGTSAGFKNSNGTTTSTVIAGSANSHIRILGNGFSGSVDDISLTQINIPASPDVATTELLADGDMEDADGSPTSSWTAGNSATLSKQTGTPHGGSQVLRVLRNGVDNPYASQTILTSGSAYRVYGYVRSDGTATPSVRQNSFATTLFTGTTSTSWQPFDVALAANSTNINLGSTATGANYVEYDDVTVVEDTSLRQGEIMQDPDMETTSTSDWIAVNSANLTKDTGSPNGGSRNLRIARNGTNNPRARQSILANGKTYRITGYARSGQGAGVGQLATIVNSTNLTNVTSTSWTYFEATFIGQGGTLDFQCGSVTVDGQYCDVDDISVTEVAPLVGKPVNSVTLGTTSGVTHLTNAYTFDGSNDAVNIYTSDLNSVFNPSEGTLVAWARVNAAGDWTDSTNRYIVGLGQTTSTQNYFTIRKSTTSNQLSFATAANSTFKSVNYTFSSTDWFQVVLTWSKTADQVKAYVNGAQVGSTQTGMGTWIGNLQDIEAAIGSDRSSGTNPWKGMINDVRLYNRALDANEIADQYNASWDVQAYYTANYHGHELLRKYDTDVTLGAFASEEVGPGPVASWNLDEGQGSTTQDATSNNKDGSITGATWQTEDQCVSGKCLFFDGSNDVVTVASSVAGIQTVSFWAKVNSVSSTEQLIDLNGTDYIESVSGVITAAGFGTETVYVNGLPGTTITANTWNYITVTTSSGLTGSAIKIGQVSSNYGQAFIDEVKIYPYARSAAQVKVDYNNGAVSLGKQNQQDFLSNGLVGYWKMDEAGIDVEGETITDSSGNGNSGTLFGDNSTGDNGTGMDCTAAGKFGTGCSFDGTDDYVSLGTYANGSVMTKDTFTVSAWFKTSAIARQEIIRFGSWTGNQRIWGMAVNSSGYIYGETGALGGSTVTGSTSVADGNWHQAIITKSGTTSVDKFVLYLDGKTIGEVATPQAGAVNSGLYITVGVASFVSTPNDNNYFNGTIDGARIYNRALSPAEVQSLYNWAPGPVGYWKMDEGSWTNDCSTGTVIDSSGYGNNAKSCPSSTGPTGGTPGKFGNAGSFDGANDEVNMGDPASGLYDFGTKDYSYGGYFKTTTNQNKVVFGKYGGTPYYYFRQVNGDVQCGMRDGSGGVSAGTSGSTYYDGNWHHGFCTRKDGILSLYVDGVLKATTDATGKNADNSNSFLLASVGSPAFEWWQGQLDDIKIYNYARTPSQIIEDMNGGHPIGGSPISSMLAHYKFDEQQGQTVNNSGNGGSSLNGTVGADATATATDPTWKTKTDCKTNGCLSFDGGDLANIYSSSLNSAFNKSEGSISLWTKVSGSGVWTDSTNRYMFYAAADVNNAIYLAKTSTSNTLQLYYAAGGTGKSVSSTLVGGSTDWIHLTLTWSKSADQMKAYINGNQVGTTQTGLGTWSGNFSSTAVVIGATNTSAANPWSGSIDEVKIYDTPLTAEQVKIDYNAGSSLNIGTTAASEASQLSDGAGNPPIGYWPMDENTDNTCTSGTNDACDKSGGGHDGAGTSHSWNPGKYGSGIGFNGSSSNVQVTTWSGANFNQADDFSIGAWVKLNALGSAQYIFNKQENVTNEFVFSLRITSSNYPEFAVAKQNVGTTTLTGTTALTTGVWYHIQAVSDGTNISLYLNGAPAVASTAITISGATQSVANIYLGELYNGSSFLNGTLDDLKLYDYARTQAQIAYDYNRGGPVGWWKMDECQGGTAYDSSGNGNNLTWAGPAGSQTSVGDCTNSGTAWYNGESGKYNSSLNFDGYDDLVAKSSPTGLPSGNVPKSMAVWIKSNACDSFGTVGGFGANSDGNNFQIDVCESSTLSLLGWGASYDWHTSISNTGVIDGNWHLLAVTYDGTNTNFYVDGSLKQTTSSYSWNTTPSNIVIGNEIDSAGREFEGQIDDFRIYNYALSATQIQKLYNEGSTVRFGPSSGTP